MHYFFPTNRVWRNRKLSEFCKNPRLKPCPLLDTKSNDLLKREDRLLAAACECYIKALKSGIFKNVENPAKNSLGSPIGTGLNKKLAESG